MKMCFLNLGPELWIICQFFSKNRPQISFLHFHKMAVSKTPNSGVCAQLNILFCEFGYPPRYTNLWHYLQRENHSFCLHQQSPCFEPRNLRRWKIRSFQKWTFPWNLWIVIVFQALTYYQMNRCQKATAPADLDQPAQSCCLVRISADSHKSEIYSWN